MLMLSILEGTTDDRSGHGPASRSTRWSKEIEEIVSGKAWGSMDITEPDAGSDMAALRTVGEQDADGQLDRQRAEDLHHLGPRQVPLRHRAHREGRERRRSEGGPRRPVDVPGARLRGRAGKRRTRLATLDRVEEKLGHHGSATVALTFDKTPAELIGKRGEGFRYMLELMNNARLASASSRSACARPRCARRGPTPPSGRSMGKTIDRHEMIADYLDEMETDIQGLRALAMHARFHEEVGHKKELFGQLRRVRPGRRRRRWRAEIRAHRAAARRATPLLKYLAAEKAVEMARRCLQIHGGNGYMREYGAEKLLRDALVMPIYEGTSQIQSLMAMKDTLGAIIKRRRTLPRKVAQARWHTLSARDALERRVARIQQLSLAAQQHLVLRTLSAKVKATKGTPLAKRPHAILKDWDPKRDFSYAMLHAERLTRLLADEQIVEVLLAQAQKHPERRAGARALSRARRAARALPARRDHHDG